MYSTHDKKESRNVDKCDIRVIYTSCVPKWSKYHLHDQEEPGDDDVGEVAGEEGEEERGQDAVLRAHAGDHYHY